MNKNMVEKKMLKICEYARCKEKATKHLRCSDGSVIARYCEKHYNKVISKFLNNFE